MIRWRLPKLTNTRDLGGLKAADGKTIREGKLVRSGKLSKLPNRTVLALKERGVDLVVDLRIENERAASSDTEWTGCRFIHLPILCVATLGSDVERNLFKATEKESARVSKEGDRIKREFGSIDNYMIAAYRSMLFERNAKRQLSTFLRLLVEEEGTILWHCASGKDRAGICAMLVEALLGVDEQTILSDYMASGRYWRKKYSLYKTLLTMVPVKRSLRRMLFGFMRTNERYLNTVIEDMKKYYGGIVEYCKAELGITDEDISILKAKYLIE